MKKLQFVFLSGILVFLAACGGPTPTTPEPTTEFSLEIDDTFTNSLSPGAEVRIPVTIKRSGDSTGAVTLEVFGAPEGVSGTFEPNPTSDTESTLIVSTENSVAAGMYSLSVRGKSGTVSATATVGINVVGTTTEPTFSLALSPASLSTEAGTTVTTTVTVNKTSSFNSSVSLSASSVPSGVTVSFDPTSTSGTAKVSVEVGSGVAAGTYTLTIEGSSGSKTSSTKLGLTVVAKASGLGRISGTARTDAYLGAFTVPTQLSNQGGALLTAGQAEYVPGQVVVQYRSDGLEPSSQADYSLAFQNLAVRVAADYGLSVKELGSKDAPSILALPTSMSVPEVVAQLLEDPRVRYAEPNHYLYPMSVPNDPRFEEQWNLAVSGVPVAWNARKAATNIAVAILDSSFDLSHPDLKFVNSGYDFCGTPNCGSVDANVSPDSDNDIHGTHLAGIAAATGNNDRGVAGVVQGGAALVPVKIFYNYNSTTDVAVAKAIRWAAGLSVSGISKSNPNPAKIISLSIGASEDSTVLREAIESAQMEGVLVVAAAGNVDAPFDVYPAAYRDVLSVGSVNSKFNLSCFSNTVNVDVVAAGGDGLVAGVSKCSSAPNEAVLSTIPGGYGTLAGTSQAAPLVAGVAALLWSQDTSQSAAQVVAKIKASAYKPSGAGSGYGAGVVRADVALGFPAVGTGITVSAVGDKGSATATATLKANGESTSFTLDNLAAGSYTVEAATSNSQRALSATKTVSLTAGESESVTLQLAP